MKIYAIFLSFYKDYEESGINEFTSLVESLGLEYELFIVSNRIDNSLSQNNFILGDNSNWEFSGWDKGIAKISSFADEDIFIFCNDTFCFHRQWGVAERRRFLKAFTRLINSGEQGMSGEVNNVNKTFNLFGHSTDRWISTYLFAMTGGLLKKNKNKLSLPESQLENAVISADQDKAVWGVGVCETLTAHIQDWLYPDSINSGWYKAKDAPPAIKLRKAKTILNEKYLSAFCTSFNGMLFPANSNLLFRAFKRLQNILKKPNHF
ncbi:hypothetical protein [Pseudomonas sp. R5(2019)]|uniref:hypothetical protein n=1 Tax=Pseudomonas sp. R5(2019) TaxID=2697566 RepID=UPI00141284C9|nr:hypothetical protein [Pseudomonas sp. R5(2019)]NBA98228.1 hypothetical protein [Pseudomonas sp. R5(2019)]